MRAETGVNTKIRVAHAFESGGLIASHTTEANESVVTLFFDNLLLIARSDIRDADPEQFVSSVLSSKPGAANPTVRLAGQRTYSIRMSTILTLFICRYVSGRRLWP